MNSSLPHTVHITSNFLSIMTLIYDQELKINPVMSFVNIKLGEECTEMEELIILGSGNRQTKQQYENAYSHV